MLHTTKHQKLKYLQNAKRHFNYSFLIPMAFLWILRSNLISFENISLCKEWSRVKCCIYPVKEQYQFAQNCETKLFFQLSCFPSIYSMNMTPETYTHSHATHSPSPEIPVCQVWAPLLRSLWSDPAKTYRARSNLQQLFYCDQKWNVDTSINEI